MLYLEVVHLPPNQNRSKGLLVPGKRQGKSVNANQGRRPIQVVGRWSVYTTPIPALSFFCPSSALWLFISVFFYSTVWFVIFHVDGIQCGRQSTKTLSLHSSHDNKLLELCRLWLIDVLPASLHACWTISRHDTELHVLVAGTNESEIWPQKENKSTVFSRFTEIALLGVKRVSVFGISDDFSENVIMK